MRERDAQDCESEPCRKILGRVLGTARSPDSYELKAINSDGKRRTVSARTKDFGEFRVVDLSSKDKEKAWRQRKIHKQDENTKWGF
jgi:hypothetical protein